MQPRSHTHPAHHLASLALAAALVAPWAITGCSSPGHAYCTQTCTCTGCATSALQQCELTADGNEKTAAEIGCQGYYDTLASCAVSQGQCIAASYQIAGCDVETKQLTNCLTSAKCYLGLDLGIHCP